MKLNYKMAGDSPATFWLFINNVLTAYSDFSFKIIPLNGGKETVIDCCCP